MSTSISPLLRIQDLQEAFKHGAEQIVLLDCSYDLAQAERGQQLYQQGHLAGALYVDLHHDLAAPRTAKSGRHPLPSKEQFIQRLRQLGVNQDSWVIAYDNANGMYAARLWWMLGWVGHSKRSVLDGHMQAWQHAGLEVNAEPVSMPLAGDIQLRPSLHKTVDYQTVLDDVGVGQWQLIDARNAERFRGQNETMDPKAGHIPGAKNRFFMQNLDEQGCFKTAEQLHAEWSALLAGRPVEQIVNQCGSGVTACHNLLALEVAGLSGSLLYPGSWSEWSQHDEAPVAV